MSSEPAVCARCGIQNIARQARGYVCGSCVVYDTANGCARCGKRRRRDSAHPTLCGHCSKDSEHVIALGDGEWVRDGLIVRWETHLERSA